MPGAGGSICSKGEQQTSSIIDMVLSSAIWIIIYSVFLVRALSKIMSTSFFSSVTMNIIENSVATVTSAPYVIYLTTSIFPEPYGPVPPQVSVKATMALGTIKVPILH